MPQVLKPAAPPVTYPGNLLSYPFFAYEEPGARLFPASWFSTSLAVAGALRTRCGYDLALGWYRRAFDPLQRDCAWVHCPGSSDTTEGQPTSDQIAQEAYLIWQQHGRPPGEADQDWQLAETQLQSQAVPAAPAAAAAAVDGKVATRPGACCDATQVTAQGARNRAVTLDYCRTLIEWGDALMRRGRSPEAFQQARILYETAARVTGPRPRAIALPEPATAATVSAFVPAYAPLNPRLMELYDLVADRLGLIRRSLDARRIRNGQPGRDMPYFGDDLAVGPRGSDPGRDAGDCAEEEDWCGPASPYRFMSQIQKAIELAGRVRELGAALLTAYEKGDAEYLASIHAEQEREMQALSIAIRQDQWRDADWQVQALQQTKDVNQTNLLYYAGLFQNGLINDEIQNLDLTTNCAADPHGRQRDRGRGRDHEHHPRYLLRGDVERCLAADRHQAGPPVRGRRQDHADGRGHPEHHRRAGHDPGGLAAPRRRVAAPDADAADRDPADRAADPRRAPAPRPGPARAEQPAAADRARDRGPGLPPRQVHRHRAVPVPAEGDRRAVPADVRAGPAGGPGGRTGLQLRPAATPAGGSSRRKPGTTCTPGCWPASASTSPCGAWRRPTSTRTGAKSS